MPSFYYKIPNTVIADFLIGHKEDELVSIGVSLGNIESKTVLEYIFHRKGMREVVYAINHGVDVNVRNSNGDTLINIIGNDFLKRKILFMYGAIED